MKTLPNFIAFQIVWALAVGAAARGLWWPGLAGVAVFAALQLYFSRAPVADLALILSAAVVGCAADSVLVQAGWIAYATPSPALLLVPAWIAGLWLAFALTLNHSLGWLHGRWTLAVLFGAIGGPLAFWIAQRLKAVTLIEPQWQGYVALSVEWALMTPLLLAMASYFLRRFPTRTAR